MSEFTVLMNELGKSTWMTRQFQTVFKVICEWQYSNTTDASMSRDNDNIANAVLYVQITFILNPFMLYR